MTSLSLDYSLPTLARLLGASGLALAMLAPHPALAASPPTLLVVKPVMSCQDLARADISHATSTPATITATTILPTPKGDYCKVTGAIAPGTVFEIDLPVDHWTQRFVESAMGHVSIENAGGCTPALDGEMAVAADNLGHVGKGQFDSAWTANPQLKIDQAYRANHETALASKAIIRAYYGQPQRFAYFVGCSEGGREALQEAQRFPDDFNGVSAGAPVAIDSVHNSFYHPWEAHANQRADGSRIFTADRLPLLHKAVVAHCARDAGTIDGMLQIPTACRFEPSWVQCASEAADTSTCLTAEEIGVVEKLYRGPSNAAGRRFEINGFPLGSELAWQLSTATTFGDRETKEGFALRRLLPAPQGNQEAGALEAAFTFDQAWYDKVNELAPLYNAANTNLEPFRQAGGKLILWQGAADTIVQPASSITYYRGIRKVMGANTDTVIRFFLLPGVGHCTGGEGPAQIDVLSPLIAWVENGTAPTMILAGKTQHPTIGAPAPGMPVGQGNLLGGPGGALYPFASANLPTQYTRPVYAFPGVARYSGQGDRENAANYRRVSLNDVFRPVADTQAASLYAPNNQKFYHVDGNQLVADVQ